MNYCVIWTITARSTWCNSVSRNVSRQSMPRDIHGTIVDCISSTSISLAATLCCEHVSTTACRAALLLTALGNEFPWKLVQVCRPPSIPSRERDTFVVAIRSSMCTTQRTTGSSLVLGSVSAKCNAIRHAKDNFFFLSFDDGTAVYEILPCGCQRLEVFSEITATRNCTVDLRVSDEFLKKEFVEE